MFIIDNGEAGIWCWVGKKASKDERKTGMAKATVSFQTVLLSSFWLCKGNALQIAFSPRVGWFGCSLKQAKMPSKQRSLLSILQSFIGTRGYSKNTPVTRVIDQGEPPEFRALFKVWEKPKVPGQTKAYSTNRIGEALADSATLPVSEFANVFATAFGNALLYFFNTIAQTVQTKFDALSMHENPKAAAVANMPDDGTGAKKVMDHLQSRKYCPATFQCFVHQSILF